MLHIHWLKEELLKRFDALAAARAVCVQMWYYTALVDSGLGFFLSFFLLSSNDAVPWPSDVGPQKEESVGG